MDLMLLKQSESGNRTVATALVTLFIFSILGAMAPPSPLSSPIQVLEDARIVAPVSVPEQTYELYLLTQPPPRRVGKGPSPPSSRTVDKRKEAPLTAWNSEAPK